MNTVNRNELCVVGLQRCGQHAVIHWVMVQARGRRCFLNDVQPQANPFRTFSPGEIETRGCRRFDLAAEIEGRLTRKDWLVYSYEDGHPAEAFGARFLEARAGYVGESARRFSMLVLRDPFNFFASRLQWGRSDVAAWSKRPLWDPDSRRVLVELWKAHAREYLGETRHLPDERTPVSFNRWFADTDYRRSLAERLRLPFTDRGLDHVPDYGPGSSFDGLRYQRRAHRMKVLERWRRFVDDPFYREIFRDPELRELSRRAFGRLPGTEQVVELATA